MTDSSSDDPFGGTHTDSDEDYAPTRTKTRNQQHNLTLFNSSSSEFSEDEAEDLAGISNEPGPSQRTPQPGKKRLQRKVLWKKNIRKLKRAEGKSYVNTAGSVVAQKTLGENCNCPRKCFDKIGEGCQVIFTEFYKLSSKNLQDSYLYGLMKRRAVERKRPRTGDRQSKVSSYVYLVISKIEYFLT